MSKRSSQKSGSLWEELHSAKAFVNLQKGSVTLSHVSISMAKFMENLFVWMDTKVYTTRHSTTVDALPEREMQTGTYMTPKKTPPIISNPQSKYPPRATRVVFPLRFIFPVSTPPSRSTTYFQIPLALASGTALPPRICGRQLVQDRGENDRQRQSRTWQSPLILVADDGVVGVQHWLFVCHALASNWTSVNLCVWFH